MSGDIYALLTTGIVVALVLFGFLAMALKFYVKVDQGTALIVNTMKAVPEVTFTGQLVLPVIHKKEFMDISLNTIEIDHLLFSSNSRSISLWPG